jgi:hypothetical protein
VNLDAGEGPVVLGRAKRNYSRIVVHAPIVEKVLRSNADAERRRPRRALG